MDDKLTSDEIEILKWCLRNEISRCDEFLIAEEFDNKTFRIDYQQRRDLVMSALRKIEDDHELRKSKI